MHMNANKMRKRRRDMCSIGHACLINKNEHKLSSEISQVIDIETANGMVELLILISCKS